MLRLVNKLARITAALGAVFVVGIGLAACGGVSGNSVANVGGTQITTDTFNHWMQIAADSSQQQTATAAAKPAVVPVPPDYKACITSLAASAPKSAARSQYKAQCAAEYTSLQSQVMQFLISADWVLGEASSRGVKVTDKAVVKQFGTIKAQQFPTPAAFATFLRQSGQTQSDLLLRVKLDMLSTNLRNKVTKNAGTVTSAQIASYYNSHKSAYATPERRDLRLILTKTKAQAQAAITAVNGGTSFATEAKKVSIDAASKAQGGVMLGVTKGQEEQALDAAIFGAPLHTLQGPVQTPFGFYVFRVQKITPGAQQTLAQESAAIKQQLVSTGQQTALTKFISSFQKKWTGMTDCRSGFVVQDCKQYKAPKTSTGGTGATGATG